MSKAGKEASVSESAAAVIGSNGQAPEETYMEASFGVFAGGRFTHADLEMSEEDVLAIYESMLLQRRFEERSAQMYGKQKIAGFLHLYIGQEAISSGTAWAMNVGLDTCITAYRDHGIALALGMSADSCMAELFGRKDGCSKGKGGSMHFFSREKGLFGGHGIVGAHIPVAAGIAFAHKYKEDGGACVAFFGDGAVWQGAFHESLNLASLYELPVIMVIENNHYAMGTSVERSAAETDLYKQSVGYAMPGALVDGMDVFSVAAAMQHHMDLARNNVPSLLEIRTYRYRGHSMSDPGKYRTREELKAKKDQDPILRLKSYVLETGIADIDRLEAMDRQVKRQVLASVEFADQSPLPEPDAIYEHVYTQRDFPFLKE